MDYKTNGVGVNRLHFI